MNARGVKPFESEFQPDFEMLPGFFPGSAKSAENVRIDRLQPVNAPEEHRRSIEFGRAT